MKFNQARVNGGRNYDVRDLGSLVGKKVAACNARSQSASSNWPDALRLQLLSEHTPNSTGKLAGTVVVQEHTSAPNQ